MKTLVSMLLALASFGATSEIFDAQSVVVLVHDGDTFSMRYHGKTVSARLRDVDAPEAGATRWPMQPFCTEALLTLRAFLQGPVGTAIIVKGRDKYRRLLVDVVFYGESGRVMSVNEILVKTGRAWAYGNKYRKQEGWAREAKVGLWAEKCVVRPGDWRNKKVRCPSE